MPCEATDGSGSGSDPAADHPRHMAAAEKEMQKRGGRQMMAFSMLAIVGGVLLIGVVVAVIAIISHR